jgi:hypothetical protein
VADESDEERCVIKRNEARGPAAAR